MSICGGASLLPQRLLLRRPLQCKMKAAQHLPMYQLRTKVDTRGREALKKTSCPTDSLT
jgi:hypothetical protein